MHFESIKTSSTEEYVDQSECVFNMREQKNIKANMVNKFQFLISLLISTFT